jgi:hypothetical protein
MHELYEALHAFGLTDRDPRRLAARIARDYNGDRALGVLAALNEAVDHSPTAPRPGEAVFTAGGSFGCQRSPCDGVKCRRASAIEVSRLAACFADRVIVPQPFPPAALAESGHHISYDMDLPRALGEDISVLWELQPAVDAGLVEVAATWAHVCPDCLRKAVEREGSLKRKLGTVVARLKARILDEVEFVVEAADDLRPRYGCDVVILDVKGPPTWFVHGGFLTVIPVTPEHRLGRALSAYVGTGPLRREVSSRLGLHHVVADDAMRSVYMSQWYAEASGVSYASDRELEFIGLRALSGARQRRLTDTSLALLAHEVPIPLSVSVDRVIRLRQGEAEAFQVYRDALGSCIREASAAGAVDLGALARDRILPEIHKIDLAIRNNRRALVGGAGRDLVIGAVAVSVGALAGLVDHTMSQIIEAVGGVGFASAIAKQVWDGAGTPREARDNPYYFLWKAQDRRKRIRA